MDLENRGKNDDSEEEEEEDSEIDDEEGDEEEEENEENTDYSRVTSGGEEEKSEYDSDESEVENDQDDEESSDEEAEGDVANRQEESDSEEEAEGDVANRQEESDSEEEVVDDEDEEVEENYPDEGPEQQEQRWEWEFEIEEDGEEEDEEEDQEEDQEPQTTLTDLPFRAMANVFEYLEYKEIVVLRKTSKSLRGFIDAYKPDMKIVSFALSLSPDHIHVMIGSEDEEDRDFDYYKEDGGCLSAYNRRGSRWKNFDMFEIFESDFSMFFRNQSLPLYSFAIFLSAYKRDGCNEKLMSIIIRLLKSRRRYLETESFGMAYWNQSQFTSILKYICPETNNCLTIVPPISAVLYDDEYNLHLDEIMETPHWKNASKLRIYTFQIDPKSVIFDFDDVDFRPEQITEDYIRMIREIFEQKTYPKMVKLSSEDDDTLKKFEELFGKPNDDDSWFFASDKPDYVLCATYLSNSKCVQFELVTDDILQETDTILV